MSQPYIGEIRMFGGNFAPLNWAFCNGQLLPIAGNDALFNLIGTTYGGDGTATFALPDLSGRVPIHRSNSHPIGEFGGSESVTLLASQLPPHAHSVLASSQPASAGTPSGNVVAATVSSATSKAYAFDGGATANLAPSAVSTVGAAQPHENRMPYLAVSFIICLFGIYPSET